MKKVIALTLYIFLCFPSVHVMAETEEYQAKISDGIQKVQIMATLYSFAPKHIIVKVNVPVEISALLPDAH